MSGLRGDPGQIDTGQGGGGGVSGAKGVTGDPVDDCALYPLFSDEVSALMRKLIPLERQQGVAVAVVVTATLPGS